MFKVAREVAINRERPKTRVCRKHPQKLLPNLLRAKKQKAQDSGGKILSGETIVLPKIRTVV
jgi:hypothetical protein